MCRVWRNDLTSGRKHSQPGALTLGFASGKSYPAGCVSFPSVRSFFDPTHREYLFCASPRARTFVQTFSLSLSLNWYEKKSASMPEHQQQQWSVDMARFFNLSQLKKEPHFSFALFSRWENCFQTGNVVYWRRWKIIAKSDPIILDANKRLA